MSDDAQLLRQFVADNSQQAFASLVERHVNLVYSAALRQVGGDAHLAWDVSQGVFLALAQNAPRLAGHAALTGWLFTTTRFICAKLVRSRQRSRAREQAASVMNEILHEAAPEPDWAAVRPILDATMHDLSETDREALLLRHLMAAHLQKSGGCTASAKTPPACAPSERWRSYAPSSRGAASPPPRRRSARCCRRTASGLRLLD